MQLFFLEHEELGSTRSRRGCITRCVATVWLGAFEHQARKISPSHVRVQVKRRAAVMPGGGRVTSFTNGRKEAFNGYGKRDFPKGRLSPRSSSYHSADFY